MQVQINMLRDIIVDFPAEIALLIRGSHGVGKSALAKLLGEIFGRVVIDLRLSQMTEGDLLGLPKLFDDVVDDSGRIIKRGRTEFMAPDWFNLACEQPVVLLLDEINRATPELMQCAFQLVYDRAIQGKRLHPETRIVACVNASRHYQVNEMDPALLDRFWVCDLVPSLKEWGKWAASAGIDGSIIEFCMQNKSHWWHDPMKHELEPNKVYPSPRSWDMLNMCLARPNASGQCAFDVPPNARFRMIAMGLVGDEAGAAYHDFVENYSREIKVEDVLENFTTVAAPRIKAGLKHAQLLRLLEQLIEHGHVNVWTKKQGRNIVTLLKTINNNELAAFFWTNLSKLARESKEASENTRLIHRESKGFILEIMGWKSAHAAEAAKTDAE